MRPAAFTRAVLRALWDGYDLDGADIQELGLKYGVIRRTVFNPAKHTDHHGVGANPGDEWFVEAPALSKAVARERSEHLSPPPSERDKSRDEQNPTVAEGGRR